MKKLLLSLIAAICLSTAAHAQPEAFAPSWLVYADLSFHSSNPGTDVVGGVNRTIDWHAFPGIGYQFHSHWVAGINLGWSQDAVRYHGAKSDSSITNNNYRGGPFLRYTSSILGSKIFYWFSQLNLSYTGGYVTAGDAPAYGKHHGFDGEIVPALGINLGKAWCLNFNIGSIGYSTNQNDAVSGVSFPTRSNFDFTLGQEYSIGVSKNFGGHKHPTTHHEPGSDMGRTDDGDNTDDNGSKKPKKKEDD